MSSSLDSAANEEDDGASHDCQTTSELVTGRASQAGTEEGAGRESRNHAATKIALSAQGSRGVGGQVLGLLLGAAGLEAFDVVGAANDTSDDAEIVAEEG